MTLTLMERIDQFIEGKLGTAEQERERAERAEAEIERLNAEITELRAELATEHECESCGSTNELSFKASAYSEVSGDDTPVWQCAKCRRDMAMGV